MNDDFEKAKSYFLQGNQYLQENMFIEAENAYIESLKLAPNRVSILINLSKVQIYLNKLDEAKQSLDKALATERNPQILINYGLIELKRSNPNAAFRSFQDALFIAPNNLEALLESVAIAYRNKDYPVALSLLERVLKIIPTDSKSWNLKGNIFYEMHNFEEAVKCFDQAILLDSTSADFHYNRGNAKRGLNQYEDALLNFNEALNRNPRLLEAYLNKANLLHHIKKFQEALDALNKASEVMPDYFEAYLMKGVIYNDMGRFVDAINQYQSALIINKKHPETLLNLGNTLSQLGKYDEARENYARAYEINPNINLLIGSLLFSKLKVCNWDNLSHLKTQIETQIKNNENCSLPFPLIAILNDERLISQAASLSYQDKYPISNKKTTFIKSEKKKIKIGYFSSDFYNHATSHLMSSLFDLHDRTQFEIIAFSFGSAPEDNFRIKLKNSFDQFIDIQDISDTEAASLSRNLNIDIAVDLKGYTQDARPGIFSNRAAPIQVNYLGYPGSMGVDFIDYIIADKVIIDQSNQEFFSEKIVYLPNCYQVNDNKKIISNELITRSKYGLPGDQFIFCSFNNNYKITPEVFDVWMNILYQVKNSVLWTLVDNSWAKDNLVRETLKRGISSDRLYFANKIELASHLARHRLADLFLDTFPCSAHTTASDALWVGLPLLTLKGDTFASRVASSLLTELNLPELITYTLSEYQERAIQLATHQIELEKIKQKLESNKLNTTLFNTEIYTKNLERAFLSMYENYLQN